jgi:hypothetical protein
MLVGYFLIHQYPELKALLHLLIHLMKKLQ